MKYDKIQVSTYEFGFIALPPPLHHLTRLYLMCYFGITPPLPPTTSVSRKILTFCAAPKIICSYKRPRKVVFLLI